MQSFIAFVSGQLQSVAREYPRRWSPNPITSFPGYKLHSFEGREGLLSKTHTHVSQREAGTWRRFVSAPPSSQNDAWCENILRRGCNERRADLHFPVIDNAITVTLIQYTQRGGPYFGLEGTARFPAGVGGVGFYTSEACNSWQAAVEGGGYESYKQLIGAALYWAIKTNLSACQSHFLLSIDPCPPF